MASDEKGPSAPSDVAAVDQRPAPDGVHPQSDDKKNAETKQQASVTFRNYTRIFSYATTLDWIMLAAATIAAIGAGLTLPLMNIVFGNTVGTFTSYANPLTGPSQADFEASINQQALYIVYLFIAKFCLDYISMFGFRIAGIRISAAMRLNYLEVLFAQSVSNLDKLPPGEAASTITGKANTVQIGVSDKLSKFLQFTTLLIGSIVIAFKYSWQLTLVTSSIMLFVLIVFSIITPIWMKLQKSVEDANGKAAAIASESIGAIRMVVACGAELRVSQRYSAWVQEARKRGLKMSPILGSQFSLIFLSVFSDFALTFWYGVKLYNDTVILSVSTVLIVLTSVLMGVMSLGNIIEPVSAVGKAANAASSFFEIIDQPIPKQGENRRGSEVQCDSNISFENVTFAYPTRPHVKVLDGVDAVFERGKLTAIVGPSGSGKSTIVGLIERWYYLSAEESKNNTNDEAMAVPDKISAQDDEDNIPVEIGGSIKIGSHDIKDLDVKFWRSQIGLVQQEPFIFNDTIFANVAYGLIGSEFENADEAKKRELVVEACEEAFADEFISRLPQGYETAVGESGIKLSGGQRQRLAIARSIIKRPQILIFDEATSSIDVRGERIVQDALDRVAKNRTTITIAHRLSTIKKADKIIVLAKGKVVEEGSHEQLLSKENGVYHNLVHAQQIIMGGVDLETSSDEVEYTEELERKKSQSKSQDDISLTGYDEPGYKQRGLVRSFGTLLIEQKAHLPWLFLTVLGAMGTGSALPLQAYLFAQVVTVFTLTREEMISASQFWALAFVYLAIGAGVAYFLMGWSSNTLSIHVSSFYRQQYFESIVTKPIQFFDSEENSTGTLTARVSQDPTQLQELMGLNMGMVYGAGFSLIACVIIGFYFGWKLTIVSLCCALPLTFVAGFFRLRYELQFEKLNALVFAESSQFAAEAFGAVRTVTSLTLEDFICARYSTLLRNHVVAATKKARFTVLVFSLSDSINLLCIALVFWYGGQLLGAREYTITSWLIIYIAVIQGSESAGVWCSFGPNMAQTSAAANRILSLRSKESKVGKIPPTELLQSEGGVAIEFKNVHFKYPTRDIEIFAGLNLAVQKGQFAALVGASGCGKSTIISLLEQFYQVQRGEITCGGINISDFDVKQYRSAISLVAQEATLFQGTIRENVLLGVDDTKISDDELHQACRDAEIHDFISSLPEGYNTDIGSKGVALSGGQKQRVAIARALIRQPKILLLDEATSSLDSESEKLVQAAFERAGKGRTMVVVAHRLATVQNADIIFVLGSAGEGAGARVLEKGNHKELVAKKGVYFQMCQSQALDR